MATYLEMVFSSEEDVRGDASHVCPSPAGETFLLSHGVCLLFFPSPDTYIFF
jgi:hypothetical protein